MKRRNVDIIKTFLTQENYTSYERNNLSIKFCQVSSKELMVLLVTQSTKGPWEQDAESALKKVLFSYSFFCNSFCFVIYVLYINSFMYYRSRHCMLSFPPPLPTRVLPLSPLSLSPLSLFPVPTLALPTLSPFPPPLSNQH